MQRHVLNHNKPTYFNIPDVEKNPNATSKQTLKQTLTVECIAVLKPSCGS